MKILGLFVLILLWTAVYYLAGVYVAADWDTSNWDSFGKAVSLIFVWLPGTAIISGVYIDVRYGDDQ